LTDVQLQGQIPARILVGEDARKMDEWVRANPDTAYDRRTR
jgi:hypothetical protein